MVRTIASADPHRQIACITLLPYRHELSVPWEGTSPRGFLGGVPRILREEVEATGQLNLSLIEGPDLLPDITGLSHDLVPGDMGMIQVDENLAARLRSLS